MSVTAVGPALAIDGPLPAPPPYRLLSIPNVIVGDGDRWMNGVNVDGYPADTPSLWEPCSTGTFRTKVEGEPPPQPRFDSFVVYEPITCSSLGMGDPDSFARRAQIVLEATESFGVEEALSQGIVLSTNPFFGDANLDLLAGGAAVTPVVGLSYLEDAIGATGRQGIIHSTPSVTSAWGADQIDEVDPDGVEGSGDEYLVTFNGTPIASGGGYIGSDPVLGGSPAAGQSWVFATGPIQVRFSEVILVGDNINGTLDTTINEATYRAERYALAVWDTALQAGVLIDWTP